MATIDAISTSANPSNGQTVYDLYGYAMSICHIFHTLGLQVKLLLGWILLSYNVQKNIRSSSVTDYLTKEMCTSLKRT